MRKKRPSFSQKRGRTIPVAVTRRNNKNISAFWAETLHKTGKAYYNVIINIPGRNERNVMHNNFSGKKGVE